MGQRLASVFSPDALRIEVELPQAVAEQLRTDPRGIVQLHDRRSVEAREVIIFPAADAATPTLTVRVLLPALDPAPVPDRPAHIRFPPVARPAPPPAQTSD